MTVKPPWLDRAELELLAGVREFPGAADNPRIVMYHQTTTLPDHLAEEDEVSWCSSFGNFCVLDGAKIEPTRSAAARSWLWWGVPVSTKIIPLGAIVVLKRNTDHGPGVRWRDPSDSFNTYPPGHVGFFYGWATSTRILLLGGNQSNAVTVAAYDADRVIGARWAA